MSSSAYIAGRRPQKDWKVRIETEGIVYEGVDGPIRIARLCRDSLSSSDPG